MNVRLKYGWLAFRRVHGQTRSLLAVFCLALGIATLMQVLAVAAGARARMEEIVADSGSRTLTINPGNVTALPNRGSGVSMAQTLLPDDYAALTRAALPLRHSAAISSGPRLVEYRELAAMATITGTQPGYFALQHYQMAQGRLLEEADDEHFARVAVLGARTATRLFGADQEAVLTPEAAVGQTILIGRMPFTVVGILAARGSGQTGISQDEGVYIPLNTALRRVFNVDYLNTILLEVADSAALAPVRKRADSLLRDAHGLAAAEEADFTLLDATRALEAASRNRQFAGIFFQGFAALTLGMAGAGIFAVNQLNVKERAGEFGLRRAVGATFRSIVFLVLGETLVLGLGGGLLGVVLGLAVRYLLGALTDWALALDGLILAQALGAALILSMLAALIPAWSAAARHPLAGLNRL